MIRAVSPGGTASQRRTVQADGDHFCTSSPTRMHVFWGRQLPLLQHDVQCFGYLGRKKDVLLVLLKRAGNPVRLELWSSRSNANRHTSTKTRGENELRVTAVQHFRLEKKWRYVPRSTVLAATAAAAAAAAVYNDFILSGTLGI